MELRSQHRVAAALSLRKEHGYPLNGSRSRSVHGGWGGWGEKRTTSLLTYRGLFKVMKFLSSARLV
jgi:hypothetical protein